jgi:MFS family permease
MSYAQATINQPARPTPSNLLRRAITASALGNATEWFDYGIYAYGLTYISAALFPGSTAEATLFALATFAISFLVRPLGGLFWGPLGDRLGRKYVLALTIIMMSVATLLVGLLPTYASIGLWAPVLLIVLRLVQGFSTGGEYGGAATFMAEYAPDKKRGFCGSFLECATLAGFSLGALLMLGCSFLLGNEAMHAWGWRLPFLIAAPLGLIGFYLRARMEDTAVFLELEQSAEKRQHARVSLKELLTEFWKPSLCYCPAAWSWH